MLSRSKSPAPDVVRAWGWQNYLSFSLLFFASFIFSQQILSQCAYAGEQIKLYGEVDEVRSLCRAAGIEIESTKLPAKIEAIRLGSSAAYSGLRTGDTIVSSRLGGNRMVVDILRGGKKFSVSLPTAPVNLLKQQPKPVAVNVPKKNGDGLSADDIPNLPPEKKANILNKYDIAVVIDRSGSMTSPVEIGNLSKWNWCENEVANLATLLKKYGRTNGITLEEFNDKCDVQYNCTPDDIVAQFRTKLPQGGTDMAQPVKRIFDDYFRGARQRPLLVAVLTDGMPTMGGDVREVIKDATRHLRSKNEIKITFLEIGSEYNGRNFLRYLDDGLIHSGANYDVVDSLAFDTVKTAGLVDSMLYALTDKETAAPPSEVLSEELQRVQDEIDRARGAHP